MRVAFVVSPWLLYVLFLPCSSIKARFFFTPCERFLCEAFSAAYLEIVFFFGFYSLEGKGDASLFKP